MFGVLWCHSDLAFCLCLDKIIRWTCFVSFCCGLRMALFCEMMSNRVKTWPSCEHQANFKQHWALFRTDSLMSKAAFCPLIGNPQDWFRASFRIYRIVGFQYMLAFFSVGDSFILWRTQESEVRSLHGTKKYCFLVDNQKVLEIIDVKKLNWILSPSLALGK